MNDENRSSGNFKELLMTGSVACGFIRAMIIAVETSFSHGRVKYPGLLIYYHLSQ